MEIVKSYKLARKIIGFFSVLGIVGAIVSVGLGFESKQPILGFYSAFIGCAIIINYALMNAVFDISDNIYFVARQNERVIGKLDEVVEVISKGTVRDQSQHD